jgi:hypothetical protein
MYVVDSLSLLQEESLHEGLVEREGRVGSLLPTAAYSEGISRVYSFPDGKEWHRPLETICWVEGTVTVSF